MTYACPYCGHEERWPDDEGGRGLRRLSAARYVRLCLDDGDTPCPRTVMRWGLTRTDAARLIAACQPSPRSG